MRRLDSASGPLAERATSRCTRLRDFRRSSVSSSRLSYLRLNQRSDPVNGLLGDRRYNSAMSGFVIAIFRAGHLVAKHNWRPLWVIYRVVDFVVCRVLVGVELPAECEVGARFRLGHWGRGTILNPS